MASREFAAVSSTTALAAVLVFLVFAKIIKNTWSDPLSKVPGPWWAAVSPFFDYFAVLSGRDYVILEKLHRIYGPVVRVGPSLVSFADADAVKEIYSGYKFEKSHIYDAAKTVPEWRYAFTEYDPEHHRHLKKWLVPVMATSNLSRMETVIAERGPHQLVRKLRRLTSQGRREALLDMRYEYACMTADVIGEIAFGEDFQSLQRGMHTVVDLMTRSQSVFLLKLAVPWALNLSPVRAMLKDSLAAEQEMTAFAKNACDAQITYMAATHNEEGNGKRHFFLGPSLDPSSLPEEKPLTKEETYGNAWQFLGAGFDTTAITLTTITYMFSKHPEWYKRCQQEVDRELQIDEKMLDKGGGNVVSHAELDFPEFRYFEHRLSDRLPLLHAFVSETQRLWPLISGGLMRRKVPKGEDRTVAGYRLPEKTTVFVSTWAYHRNAGLWDNPTEFRPERFLDETKKSSSNVSYRAPPSHIFIPFAYGSRMCPGRHLALMEVITTMALLLREFDFDVRLTEQQKRDEPNLFTSRFTLDLKSLHVNIKPRKFLI